MDRMTAPYNTERLAGILREAGADVDVRWRNTVHGLTFEEVGEKDRLSRALPSLSA